MAEEIQIPGAQSTAKLRAPWAVAVLSIVTILIYYFVWYYKINREMADLGRARGKTQELGDSPGKSLLAVTLGALVVIPALISVYNTGKRIQATQREAGIEPLMNGWLSVVMYVIFSPLMFAYWQSELNKAWTRLGGQEPADPPYPADPAPPAATV